LPTESIIQGKFELKKKL